MTSRHISLACLVLAAVLLIGAGAYLVLGTDKGLGIFLVLIAAILCRPLVLDIPASLARRDERRRS